MTTLRKLDFPLVSNEFVLSTAEDRLGALTPTPGSAPIERVRTGLASDGYVWLKGFLDRDAVLALRERFFASMVHTGLLKQGSQPLEGIFAGGGEDKRAVNKMTMQFVRSAAYESFCLQDTLWRLFDDLFGAPSYLHKRKIVRHTAPGDPNATKAHYDLIFLRGGSDTVVSLWIPLGDIPIEMGGLLYLESSAVFGRELEADFARKNADLSPQERVSAFNEHMTEGWLTKDLPALAERAGSRWLAADYEAGDIVIHGAYTIHAATMNKDASNRLRLSTDIRYQDIGKEIDARWNNHWSLDDML